MSRLLATLWIVLSACLWLMGERPGMALLGGLFTVGACYLFARTQ